MKSITCFLLLCLTACSPQLAPDYTWSGKKWVLYELNGSPVQTSGSETDAHLQFDPSNRRFSGSGGCNRIMGGYKIEGKSTISFGKVGSTLMACPDMAFEQKFLEALPSVNRFEQVGNELLLQKDNTIVMRLR